MLNKLDRYILKKFLSILVFTILGWIGFFIIIDLTENLNKFLSHHATGSQIFYYYMLYIPYIVALISPISMLIAASFSFGMMAKSNEIVAMQSSGISLYRILFPIFGVGVIMSVLMGFAGETIVPDFNRERLDFLRYTIKKMPKKSLSSRSNIVVKDNQNTICYIRYYQPGSKTASHVAIITLDSLKEIQQRVDSKKMIWDSIGQNWLLIDVTQRIFQKNEQVARLDTFVFKPNYTRPENLTEVEIKPEEMSFSELKKFIHRLENMGLSPQKWLVDLHMKVAYPLTNLIVLLIGAPIASRKRRSGPVLGIILGFVVSFIYFVFLRIGQVLGHRGTLDPLIAAWIGNFIFILVGLILIIKVRK
ncbi:MAG: LPS export ABC transporter permease LptG [Calditrichia bacterium]